MLFSCDVVTVRPEAGGSLGETDGEGQYCPCSVDVD